MADYKNIRRCESLNMINTCFFTICSKNFIAYARTLYFSLKSQYPDLSFYVALCDTCQGLDKQPFEIVEISDLNIPDLEGMANRYNITELNTAIKPFVFEYLFGRTERQQVVYLDPDILVVSRLIEVERAFKGGASAVLTPHILQPAENVEVHDQKMLQFGIYNLGFIALCNTPEVRNTVAWWGRRLEQQCVIRLEEGLFVDQKWADLLPAFIDRVHILRHPGYNVAYWNLSQRKVCLENGQWFVNREPLRFVHFSGNKLDDSDTFSRHSAEITVQNIGDLAILLKKYRESVYNNGHRHYSAMTYEFNWNGETGVNLHTPEPDNTHQDNTYKEIKIERHKPASKPLHQSRIKVFYHAVMAYRRASGGWKMLLQRVVLVVRKDGFLIAIRKVTGVYSRHYVSATIAVGNDSNSMHLLQGDENILFIDWSTPKPDQDAGSVTAYYLLKILTKIGYNVTFVPSDLKNQGKYTEAVEQLGITCLHFKDITSIDLFLENHGKQFQYFFLCRAPIAGLYIDAIRKHVPEATIILNTSDLHYLRDGRQAELAGNSDEKAVRDYLEHVKETELEVIRKCDISIVMSEVEYSMLQKDIPESDVRHIPLMFIDVSGKNKPFYERQDILFIGGFPHQPNVDAVLFFCKEIWPIVHRQLPDVTFIIIGCSPPEQILELDKLPGVSVKGFVQDISRYFDNIRLSVAPLRYGAGIKGKIGTSLGYGVPSVVTSMAAEGMPLVDGQHVLIADDPASFAKQVIGLYSDEELWQRLSAAGMRLIQKEYSVEAGIKRISVLFGKGYPDDFSLSFREIYSYEEYESFLKMSHVELNRQRKLELAVIQHDQPSFTLNGKCAVCLKDSCFNVSYMYAYDTTEDGKPIPNWREHLDCKYCGLVNRVRAALHYFHQEMNPQPSSNIYITEHMTPLYQWLKQRYKIISGSEYFGDACPFGEYFNDIRNEDLMHLTFPDNLFDYILSFDVLEHVPFPEKAFKQIYRCLKPGGRFLFSAPFSVTKRKNTIRATLQADGTIDHHLPPEYHGNPVDHENGALCFQYFGWEVIEQLTIMGFSDVKALAYWSDVFGYLGKSQLLFVASKPLQELDS